MSAVTSSAKPNMGAIGRFWSRYGVGYLFVAPAFVLYVVFMIYPFFSSFILSLQEWNGADPVKQFVGLGNYVRIAQDRLFWLSLQHNAIWMVLGTITPITLGLMLALLLWSRPVGFLFFRTVFFLPLILGDAILGIMWVIVYQPRRGILYQIGQMTGWEALKFSPLADVTLALYAVLVAGIWGSVGFFFVILLAGLQNVDADLIDAARVDGANAWQRFRHVVIPQLSHVLTMVTVLALIGGLRVFGIIWAITRGGPANGTEVIATYAYTKFSAESDVGYSAALTMIMAALALLVTVVFIRVRERREV
jgi:raffinose/stachyose/melibiose transport system permease protein